MKKLNLKNAESMLSRKEMKNIMAGSGGGMDYATCWLWCPTQGGTGCEYLTAGSSGPGWYCRVG